MLIVRHRKEKYYVISLYVESKKVKYIEAESRTMVTTGEDVGEMLVKGYKVVVM